MAQNIKKKTQKNEQKKIETYFARALKSPKVEIEKDNVALNEPEKFYEECLQNQLSEISEVETLSIGSAENEIECRDEKAYVYVNEEDVIKKNRDHFQLKFDLIFHFHFISKKEMGKDIMIRELKAELRISKRLYLKSLQNNFQKDMKIAHLEKMLKNAGNETDQPRSEPLFANFSMHFHPRQLAFLRSMSVDKRADASFVRTCLEYIYNDDLAVLQKKIGQWCSKTKGEQSERNGN